MIEHLKELPTPPENLPPCDVRFITVYCTHNTMLNADLWSADWHRTLKAAQADGEYCIPGTLRIFEVPKEGGNGIES